jgi:hypothetical protein
MAYANKIVSERAAAASRHFSVGAGGEMVGLRPVPIEMYTVLTLALTPRLSVRQIMPRMT